MKPHKTADIARRLSHRVLSMLASASAVTSDDVAAALGIRSQQAARRHLRKLVEEGLVERSGHDYRITNAGRVALGSPPRDHDSTDRQAGAH